MLLNTASKVMAGGVPAKAVYAGDVKVWPPAAAVQPDLGKPLTCPRVNDSVILGGILRFTPDGTWCNGSPRSSGTSTVADFWGMPSDGVRRTVRLNVTLKVAAGDTWHGVPAFIGDRYYEGSQAQVSGPVAPLGPGTHTQVWDLTDSGNSGSHPPSSIHFTGLTSSDVATMLAASLELL